MTAAPARPAAAGEWFGSTSTKDCLGRAWQRCGAVVCAAQGAWQGWRGHHLASQRSVQSPAARFWRDNKQRAVRPGFPSHVTGKEAGPTGARLANIFSHRPLAAEKKKSPSARPIFSGGLPATCYKRRARQDKGRRARSQAPVSPAPELSWRARRAQRPRRRRRPTGGEHSTTT